jgi:signal peptidase
MFLIALPVLIYINSSSYLDEREHKAEYTFEEDSFSIWDIPITAFLVILAALVSGVFPHYMIGVGSQSMSPTINKGDAIILSKVSKDEQLKKGDIIAFTNNEKVIIHRIQDITVSNDGKRLYVTKGDANNGVDSNLVSLKQVRGVVRAKIPYVAYPTIWFTSYLKKGD